MENLGPTAKKLFEEIPKSTWSGKNLLEIEGEIQKIINQLGNKLMDEYILPSRVKEIEEQPKRCECGRDYEVKKKAHKTILGQYGSMVLERTQYFCEACNKYSTVSDEELGLINHRVTPRIALLSGLCGASWSYKVSEAFMGFFLGVEISYETLRRITTNERLQPKPLPSDPLDNPPGVVGMDGILIRGREKDKWLEMKVGCFFSHVVEVSDKRREVLDGSFVGGAMQKWEDFEGRVTAEAFRRGLDCTEEVEFVSDGEEGIWSLQETVFPNARTRLDLYHAKKKVSERTKEGFRDDPLKRAHKEFLLGKLEKGEVMEAIGYLEKHMPQDEEKKKPISRLIRYIKRHESHIPNYMDVKSEGGTVSSGLIEKGNDLVVAARMKDDKMHWTRQGADPIIVHRTNFINKYARNRTGPYALAFCSHGLQ